VRTPPRSIVLDMDGVVLESTEIKTRAFAQVFAPYPEHVSAIVRFHEAHVGLSRYEKFRIIYRDILGQPLEPAALIELGREFSALVLDEILVCPLVAGAERLLEENASNRLLFVASATPEEELREIIDRRELARFFRGVYGSPATKTEILRRILNEHSLQPGELLFVGDSASDLDHAQAAGVEFVGRIPPGAPDTFRAWEESWIVEDLTELADILAERSRPASPRVPTP
jgi:phosphoglycolate phosphatase-like HAD superfamily hydrolase